MTKLPLRVSVPIALTLAMTGCAEPAQEPPEELTSRQRDSMIGESKVIPGAAGVRGAIRVSDSAAARRARLDSLSAIP